MVDYDHLEITTPIHAGNGDLIGEQILTVKREGGTATLSLSSPITSCTLPPHEAGYLAGWLMAGLSADQEGGADATAN